MLIAPKSLWKRLKAVLKCDHKIVNLHHYIVKTIRPTSLERIRKSSQSKAQIAPLPQIHQRVPIYISFSAGSKTLSSSCTNQLDYTILKAIPNVNSVAAVSKHVHRCHKDMDRRSMVRKHRNPGTRRTAAKTAQILHRYPDDDHDADVKLQSTKSRGRITVCAFALGQPRANLIWQNN